MIDLVVVGLGYVGLPLAREACRSGLRVAGLDTSAGLVTSLMDGRSHVDDVTDDDVRGMVRAGFTAGTDASVIGTARIVVICVPTPLDDGGAPDLGAVRAATTAVGGAIAAGTTVVLESTTWPGTTEEVVVPILEECSGLRVGEDLHVAFSPERIDPGNGQFGIRNTPKVVGGVTPACTEAAARLYERVCDTVVRASGPKEAETAKLLENTYRHVNIALVNEMAQFCHDLGIDLWEVIRCAATKPFGFHAFHPGPGVGGHCIPIDPNYLSYRVRSQLGHPFRFVELAQELNQGMPDYVVRRIQDRLNDEGLALKGSTVLLLGISYKRDIADQRESPARPIAESLIAKGATVRFHDPGIAVWLLDGQGLAREDDLDAALASSDITVLLQDHSSYDLTGVAEQARRMLDTRGRTRPSATVERL